MRDIITTSIAFTGLSDKEFSDALNLKLARHTRSSMIAGRNCGFPRTSVEITEEMEVDEICDFVFTHNISVDRIIVFVHIASDSVNRVPLPKVAVAAIHRLGVTDIRVSVVPPFDDEQVICR